MNLKESKKNSFDVEMLVVYLNEWVFEHLRVTKQKTLEMIRRPFSPVHVEAVQ